MLTQTLSSVTVSKRHTLGCGNVLYGIANRIIDLTAMQFLQRCVVLQSDNSSTLPQVHGMPESCANRITSRSMLNYNPGAYKLDPNICLIVGRPNANENLGPIPR